MRSSFQSADTIIQREYVNTRESHPNETEQTPFLFVIIEMGQDNESMRRYRARIRPVGAAPVRRPLASAQYDAHGKKNQRPRSRRRFVHDDSSATDNMYSYT